PPTGAAPLPITPPAWPNHRRAVSCDTPAAHPASLVASPARMPSQNRTRTGRGRSYRPPIATLPFHQERCNDPLNPRRHHDPLWSSWAPPRQSAAESGPLSSGAAAGSAGDYLYAGDRAPAVPEHQVAAVEQVGRIRPGILAGDLAVVQVGA